MTLAELRQIQSALVAIQFRDEEVNCDTGCVYEDVCKLCHQHGQHIRRRSDSEPGCPVWEALNSLERAIAENRGDHRMVGVYLGDQDPQGRWHAAGPCCPETQEEAHGCVAQAEWRKP